jgi:hypothetical protein
VLFRKKDKFNAIKLYSIGLEQERIDRPAFIEELLKFFENKFEELPKEYVIHGPYGVRKGGSIGIKAFKNKLRTKGHEKYYALDGSTESRFGFHVSFDSILDGTTYSELIIWCKANEYQLPFEETIEELTIPFSTSCGFEIEIDEGIDVFSEGKIKKGLLGGLSIESSHEHINWIKSFDNGEFRALFKNNLFSSKQLDKLLSTNPESKHTEFGKLHFVQASA